MVSSFTDCGLTLEDFSSYILVHCPKCNRRAFDIRISNNDDEILADETISLGRQRYLLSQSPRKISCLHCSYSSTIKNVPRGWYSYRQLWLQTPCCGKTLWAFNQEHLSFLERYVTAKQRVKYNPPSPPFLSIGTRNGTMASRLPTWTKRAENREAILKGTYRLRKLLEQS